MGEGEEKGKGNPSVHVILHLTYHVASLIQRGNDRWHSICHFSFFLTEADGRNKKRNVI